MNETKNQAKLKEVLVAVPPADVAWLDKQARKITERSGNYMARRVVIRSIITAARIAISGNSVLHECTDEKALVHELTTIMQVGCPANTKGGTK